MMKKTVILMIIASIAFTCNSKQNEETNTKETKSEVATNKVENSKVQVYYFHYTRRCETCKEIEQLANDIIATKFADKAYFDAYNIEEEYGEKVAKEVGVDEQKLLLIKGKKTIDLTNEAFLYVSDQPEKFEEIMVAKLNELLQ